MIAALLLAASLITPPHGMGRVPPASAEHTAFLKRIGVTQVEHYRGIASTKWENHWYKTTFEIGVERYNINYDPVYAAMYELSTRANPSAQYLANSFTYACTRKKCVRVPWKPKPPVVLAFRPVTLCHGERGWLSKTLSSDLENTIVRVYARAGGNLYAAWTNFSKANGDVFHAERAVETLCPPDARAPDPLDPPAQIRSPQGWAVVDPETVPQIGEEMDVTGAWMKLTPGSLTINTLLLAQGSDVDENVTPEQESDFMRQSVEMRNVKVRTVTSHAQSFCGDKDGWYRTFSAKGQDGYMYRVISESAYYNGMSYELALADRMDQRDDPAALTALRSFCPKNR